MRKIFFLTVLIFVVSFCAASCAEVSRLTVSKAWKRITKADGFTRTPIIYENSGESGAWVEQEDDEKFTVHVTKNMMKILDTEDEIAGVLAHELGHIRLRHDGMRLFMRNTAGINSEVDVSETENNFDLNQEIEADVYGTELLRKARYNPRGLYDAAMKLDDSRVSEKRLARLAEAARIVSGIEADSLLGMNDIAKTMLGR